MRKVAIALLIASRTLGILAIVAGVGAGLLVATLIAALTCFDSCPAKDAYFFRQSTAAQRGMWPCVALEALALACFLAHCFVARQRYRALRATLMVALVGAVGVGVLMAVFTHGEATLPVTSDGLLAERPAEQWASLWGLTLALVAAIWTGIPMSSYFQRFEMALRRPPTPSQTPDDARDER